jgi:hypothetical protein
MHDPRTFWLTLTNIVLGLAVVALTFGVFTGIICEGVARFRERRRVSHELDGDMRRMFHGSGRNIRPHR